MATYYELQLDDGTIVYQHVEDNVVVSYLDTSGNYLYDEVPVGIGSTIIALHPTIDWV